MQDNVKTTGLFLWYHNLVYLKGVKNKKITNQQKIAGFGVIFYIDAIVLINDNMLYCFFWNVTVSATILHAHY